jgi:hypothetical protein
VEGKHWSSEVDILFECWAVADRLGLHKVAAHCEWAMASVWTEAGVHARAALELSPGAVRRITRSLRARMDAASQELQRVLSFSRAHYGCHLEKNGRSKIEAKVEKVCRCLTAAAPAGTMAQWRIDDESMPSTWRQTVGAVVTWLGR